MDLTFLSTDAPLTKTITKLKDGSLHKEAYPHRKNFTSLNLKANNLNDLFKHIKAQSMTAAKPCLLKGKLERKLNDESRAGATRTETTTHFICFDLDRAQFNNPDEFMKSIGMDHVAYVVQYSSSYKLDPKDKTLSCHIFVWLSSPRPAPELKAWLMHLNLTITVLKDTLTLAPAGHALHWPLDITVCQNDKLIYIAEPIFNNMKSPIPPSERVQLVPKVQLTLDVTKIVLRPLDTLKKEARTIVNNLRIAAGMDKLNIKTTMDGEHETQRGVGEITHYEVFDDGLSDFIYFNLNGGNSKGYFHPRGNLKLLHNFKGEAFPYIKDILPRYYAERMHAASSANTTPNETGDTLLAFCDKATGDYYKGTWNEGSKHLEIHRAKNRVQIEDFLKGHGRPLGDFVPEWQLKFDPLNPTVYDPVDHIINTFTPSHYMHEDNQRSAPFPNIQELLDSAVGTKEVQAAFLDWLAYMFQTRQKPQTAWILHGTYGTGKGMLINKVLMPLFGRKHVHAMRASEFNEKFNGWMENALIVFVDEIDADMFTNAKGIESDMRNLITEPSITIRRMRTDAYMVNNFTGFIFASNKNQPVHIPVGDRRYNVGSYQTERYLPSEKVVTAIGSDKELSAFAHHLQHRATNAEAARTILQTEERTAIQHLGITSLDATANALKEGDFGTLLDALPDAATMHEQANGGSYTASMYVDILKRILYEKQNKFTRDELHCVFKHCTGSAPDGAYKFSKMLRHHGLDIKVIRNGEEVFRGLEINWNITDNDRAYMVSKFPSKTKLKAVK